MNKICLKNFQELIQQKDLCEKMKKNDCLILKNIIDYLFNGKDSLDKEKMDISKKNLAFLNFFRKEIITYDVI